MNIQFFSPVVLNINGDIILKGQTGAFLAFSETFNANVNFVAATIVNKKAGVLMA